MQITLEANSKSCEQENFRERERGERRNKSNGESSLCLGTGSGCRLEGVK
jgi:hypothetical protein